MYAGDDMEILAVSSYDTRLTQMFDWFLYKEKQKELKFPNSA